MKILVLSLLRLGDIIQQAPLLKGLREKYPDAEIHLLLNKQFASVGRILDGVVDRYLFFDREGLQKGLGEASYNILWSYNQVESLVTELNAESYDIAINMTHNKLSAYLMGALEIKDKRGLHYQEGRFKGLSNRWIRYFNDRFSGNQKSLFHYVELLGKAFDIALPVEGTPQRRNTRSKLILFQCLTSDSKKNWGLERFHQLKRTIETALNDFVVLVLGAPFEKEALLKVFSEKDLLICDLADARKQLQKAAVLVTGDTSVKHIAAQVGTPLVEISIGSSDAKKTGAFSNRAMILQGAVACAPCEHSKPCSQAQHLCAEDVTVEKVFSAVWDQLSDEKVKGRNIHIAFERSVWGLYLDSHDSVEPFYRAAVEEFVSRVGEKAAMATLDFWNEQTALYRSWLTQAQAALPSRVSLAQQKNVQDVDISKMILCAQEILKSKKDEAGYFTGFVEALLSRFVQPVQVYDHVMRALQETHELLTIRENFIRHLQTLSMEGAYYAKGIGQLSIGGFEEVGSGVLRDIEDAEL